MWSCILLNCCGRAGSATGELDTSTLCTGATRLRIEGHVGEVSSAAPTAAAGPSVGAAHVASPFTTIQQLGTAPVDPGGQDGLVAVTQTTTCVINPPPGGGKEGAVAEPTTGSTQVLTKVAPVRSQAHDPTLDAARGPLQQSMLLPNQLALILQATSSSHSAGGGTATLSLATLPTNINPGHLYTAATLRSEGGTEATAHLPGDSVAQATSALLASEASTTRLMDYIYRESADNTATAVALTATVTSSNLARQLVNVPRHPTTSSAASAGRRGAVQHSANASSVAAGMGSGFSLFGALQAFVEQHQQGEACGAPGANGSSRDATSARSPGPGATASNEAFRGFNPDPSADARHDLPTANLYRVQSPSGHAVAAKGRSRTPKHAGDGLAPSPLGPSRSTGHCSGAAGSTDASGRGSVSRQSGAPIELVSTGVGSDAALAMAAGLIIGGPHLGSTGSSYNAALSDAMAQQAPQSSAVADAYTLAAAGNRYDDGGAGGFPTFLSGPYSFDGVNSLISGPSNIYSFDEPYSRPTGGAHAFTGVGAAGSDIELVSRLEITSSPRSGAGIGGADGGMREHRAWRIRRTAERREFLAAAKCINAVLQDVQIISVIGAGAHGKVYKGALRDRFVAVKVILHEADVSRVLPGTAEGGIHKDPSGASLAAELGHASASASSAAASASLTARAALPAGSGLADGRDVAGAKQVMDAAAREDTNSASGSGNSPAYKSANRAAGGWITSRPAVHTLNYQRAGSSNLHALPLILPGSTDGGSQAAYAPTLPVLNMPGMPPIAMPHKTMLEGLISASAQHPNIVETYRIVTQLLSSPGMPAFVVTRGSQSPFWETTNLPPAAFLGIANTSLSGVESAAMSGAVVSPTGSVVGGLPPGAGSTAGSRLPAAGVFLGGRQPRLQRASSLGPCREGGTRIPPPVSPLGLAGQGTRPDVVRRSGSSGVPGGGCGVVGSSDLSASSGGAKATAMLLGHLSRRNTFTARNGASEHAGSNAASAVRSAAAPVAIQQSSSGLRLERNASAERLETTATATPAATAAGVAEGPGLASAGPSAPLDSCGSVAGSERLEHCLGAAQGSMLGTVSPRIRVYLSGMPAQGPNVDTSCQNASAAGSGAMEGKTLGIPYSLAEGTQSGLYDAQSSPTGGSATPRRGSTANSVAAEHGHLSVGDTAASAAVASAGDMSPLPLREGSTISVSALVRTAGSSCDVPGTRGGSTASDGAGGQPERGSGISRTGAGRTTGGGAVLQQPSPPRCAKPAATNTSAGGQSLAEQAQDGTGGQHSRAPNAGPEPCVGGPEFEPGVMGQPTAGTVQGCQLSGASQTTSGHEPDRIGVSSTTDVAKTFAIRLASTNQSPEAARSGNEQDSAELILDLLGAQAAAQRSASFLLRQQQRQQPQSVQEQPSATAASQQLDGAVPAVLQMPVLTPPMVPPTPRAAPGATRWADMEATAGAADQAAAIQPRSGCAARAPGRPAADLLPPPRARSPHVPSSMDTPFQEAPAPHLDYMVADDSGATPPHVDHFGLTTALFSSYRTDTSSMASRPLSGVTPFGHLHYPAFGLRPQSSAGVGSTGAKSPSPQHSPLFRDSEGAAPSGTHHHPQNSQQGESSTSNASFPCVEPSLALPPPLPPSQPQPHASTAVIGSSAWLPTIDELTAGVSALPPTTTTALSGPARSSTGSTARTSLQRATSGASSEQPGHGPAVGTGAGRTSTGSGVSLPSGAGTTSIHRSMLSSNAGGMVLPAELQYDKLSWSNYTHTSASTNAMLNSGFTALLASINTAGGSAGGGGGVGGGGGAAGAGGIGNHGAASSRLAESAGAHSSRRTANTPTAATTAEGPYQNEGHSVPSSVPAGSDSARPHGGSSTSRPPASDLRQLLAGSLSRSFTDARSSRSSLNARRKIAAGTGAMPAGAQPGSVWSGAAGQPGRERWQVLIVQELCSRGNLRDAIAAGAFHSLNIAAGTQVIAMRQLLDTAAEIASAMAYLHSRSIVHGDLKTANVLLQRNDADPRGFVCKLADFGLARQLGRPGMEDGLLVSRIGTVTHMAPETIQDNKVVLASDVYSYGVIMWELYSAQRPFANYSPFQLLTAVVQYDERPQFPVHCPPAYAALAVRCMAKDPRDRPKFPEAYKELSAIRDTLFGGSGHGTISVPLTQARSEATRILQSHLQIVSGSIAGAAGGMASGTVRDHPTQETNITSSLESWDVYSRGVRPTDAAKAR